MNADVPTVGEAMKAFTKEYGLSVNALYKGMVTDIVGTTHLNVVNARFKRDAIWSLGMMTTLDLLLKNYPEPGQYEKIISALLTSSGLDEAEIRADAKTIEEWTAGKTREDIESALKNADDSTPLGSLAAGIKDDEFWMYSRNFGIGLVKMMENVGIEMDKDEVYPVIENWMSTQLGKPHLTACVRTLSNATTCLLYLRVCVCFHFLLRCRNISLSFIYSYLLFLPFICVTSLNLYRTIAIYSSKQERSLI